MFPIMDSAVLTEDSKEISEFVSLWLTDACGFKVSAWACNSSNLIYVGFETIDLISCPKIPSCDYTNEELLQAVSTLLKSLYFSDLFKQRKFFQE